jgi:hypothetical protein
MLGASQSPEVSPETQAGRESFPGTPVVPNPLPRLLLPGLFRVVIAGIVVGGLVALCQDVFKAQENFRTSIRPALTPNFQISRPWVPYTPPVMPHVPHTWPQPQIPVFQPHIPIMQPITPTRGWRR